MNKIAIFCDKIVKWTLYFLVFVLPIFFLPWTFETLEFNKQNLLIVATLISGLAWLGKILSSKEISLRKSFGNILVLLYAVIYILSTIFSFDRIRSFIGASGVEKDGLITLLCFVLLYFVIINNVREIKTIKNLLYSFLIGSSLLGVFSLLNFLGLTPSQLIPGRSLNTVGTLSSLGIFLTVAFVLSSTLLLKIEEPSKDKKSLITKILLVILAGTFLLLAIFIDTWMIWASFAPALAFFLAFAILRANEIKNLSWLALPMVALVMAILFFFIRTPINLNLPAEIMPSFSASGQIAKQTLQEAPLFGSGPSTFSFDYAKYRPSGVNLTPLWNIQFDRSASRVLTMLATIGLLGFFSWFFLIIFLIVQNIANLIKEKVGALWLDHLGLASAWFLLLLAKFLYSSNLTLEFLFWIFTALLVVLTSRKVWQVSLARAPRTSLLLSFLLTLGLLFAVSSFYLLGQRYAADLNFKRAVLAGGRGEDLQKINTYLNKAVLQNRWNDVYVRGLAENLLAQINQELTLEPNEERARKIQDLIALDIDVAKRAIEISPKNSANLVTLATIYQTILPIISGADEWALTSWQKAIELEPSNPLFYTEFGRVYIGMADLASADLQAEDPKIKREAEAKVKENLAKAEEQFNRAISLKNDYAPAHFELALIYGRQGKIEEAITKLENLKINLPNDIGVAFQLGLLYYQNQELDKAIVELERAIQLAPNFANARWYLAAIYEEQGKKDLAIAQLEEILKTNPENENVKKKLEDLKSPPAELPSEMPEPLSEEPEKQ